MSSIKSYLIILKKNSAAIWLGVGLIVMNCAIGYFVFKSGERSGYSSGYIQGTKNGRDSTLVDLRAQLKKVSINDTLIIRSYEKDSVHVNRLSTSESVEFFKQYLDAR